MTSRWIELARNRRAAAQKVGRLVVPDAKRVPSRRPAAVAATTPTALYPSTDLSWCPLYQRHLAGQPMGSVEAEMLRILALPFLALDLPRCPDRIGYGEGLLNHATPDPEFRLNATQIDAIYTYETVGGLLGPIAVGVGKTFITLACAAIAMRRRGHDRVAILVPPEVIDQLIHRDLPEARRLLALDGTPFHAVTGTRDQRHAAVDKLLPGVYIVSYSTLSTATGHETLQTIGASCYILDEAHKVARATTARTKRLFTAIRQTEQALQRVVEMVALSGTITRKSIADYAHLSTQCLQAGSPLPTHPVAIGEWSDVLDADRFVVSGFIDLFRYLLDWAKRNGAVIESPVNAPKTMQEILREAHAHRMHVSPGIVATTTQSVACSLVMHWREPRMPIDETGNRVRSYMQAVANDDVTPDGDEIDWAMHKWKWLWELSSGFYNSLIWPTTEAEIERQARRGKVVTADEADSLIGQAAHHHCLLQVYHRELRQFLGQSHIPGCDTPALVAAEIVRQVVDGKKTHRLDADLIESYRVQREAWFEDLPERISVPTRLCDYKIEAAVAWAKDHVEDGGLIWHHHPEIGRWLCERLREEGVAFTYAPAGNNEAPFKPGLVVCSYAHGTGKNLQHQHQQLFLEIRRESSVMEQTIGRTHRQGQKADEVHADLFIANGFDLTMFSAVLRDADYVQSTTKQQQKLCYASYDPIVPPIDPRLYVKLGLLRDQPSSIRVRVFDQVTDDRQVADLFRVPAYKPVR